MSPLVTRYNGRTYIHVNKELEYSVKFEQNLQLQIEGERHKPVNCAALDNDQPGGADQPTHPGQNVKLRRTVDCCLRSAAESWSRTMSATPSSPALSVNSKSVGWETLVRFFGSQQPNY